MTKYRVFPHNADLKIIMSEKLFFTCDHKIAPFPCKVDIKGVMSEKRFFK